MNELKMYEDFVQLANMGKSDIKELARKQVEYIIENGEAENNAAFFKKCQVLFEEVQDGIRDSAITSVSRGSDYFHGVKMGLKGITTYDYSNDAVWAALKKQLSDRESFLKGLKEPISTVNEETGEIIKNCPPVKKVSEYIKFDF